MILVVLLFWWWKWELCELLSYPIAKGDDFLSFFPLSSSSSCLLLLKSVSMSVICFLSNSLSPCAFLAQQTHQLVFFFLFFSPIRRAFFFFFFFFFIFTTIPKRSFLFLILGGFSLSLGLLLLNWRWKRKENRERNNFKMYNQKVQFLSCFGWFFF